MILGIDTSNYTTSAAIYDQSNGTINNFKKMLPVKQGERGLRQSDAVYHHTANLPEVIDKAFDFSNNVDCVGVSVRPRDVEGSYMPCFKAGYNVANTVSKLLNVPMFEFSHQAGHIAAALYSSKRLDLISERFVAFHFSGGTSEAVLVTPDENNIFNCELISSSSDLKAGQVVDRCGVALGMGFPCGAELELLSNQSDKNYKIKTVVRDGKVSLSGVENKFLKMLDNGESECDIAKFTIQSICSAVDAMTQYIIDNYGKLPLVYAGGVMSNKHIKSFIENKYNGYFAEPEFSTDNSAGIALLAAYKGGFI